VTSTELTPSLAAFKPGTWTIDPVHSEVGFTVRHMMVSKVRGRFSTFTGEITAADTPLQSTVQVEVDLSSIDTNAEQRDNHLRSTDFFATETHPTMTYQSTGVRADGDDFIVDGDLTLKGVTKSVPLKVEFNGAGPDAYGGTRAGFSATAEISRKDFGVDFNIPLEGGGVVIGDKVNIHLEIEAVLQQPEQS
jgi:polyisoprenoid-binding protein YceI